MFSSKNAAQLASKKLDRELSLIESMGLKMPLMMCTMYKNYTKQIQLIHDVIGSVNYSGHYKGTLSEKYKNWLRAELAKKK